MKKIYVFTKNSMVHELETSEDYEIKLPIIIDFIQKHVELYPEEIAFIVIKNFSTNQIIAWSQKTGEINFNKSKASYQKIDSILKKLEFKENKKMSTSSNDYLEKVKKGINSTASGFLQDQVSVVDGLLNKIYAISSILENQNKDLDDNSADPQALQALLQDEKSYIDTTYYLADQLVDVAYKIGEHTQAVKKVTCNRKNED